MRSREKMENSNNTSISRIIGTALLIIVLLYCFSINQHKLYKSAQIIATEEKRESYRVCELINSNITDVEEDIDNGTLCISFENGAKYYDKLTASDNQFVTVAKLEVDGNMFSEELVDNYLHTLLKSEVYDEIYHDFVDGDVKDSYEYSNHNHNEVVKFHVKDLPDNRKVIALESVNRKKSFL